MICFGASSSLKHRFRAIPRQAWRGMLSDPYSLFAVILSDLHLQMDSQVWAVAEPIRELENVRLNSHTALADVLLWISL